MKKLATLLLAAGMVVASSAPASAADIKVGGFHQFTFETGNTGFQGANDEEVLQRTRLSLAIAASENLKGFIEFQMGTNKWGDYNGGVAGGSNNSKNGRYDVQTRQAYVDWTIPATNVKVRMGRSCFGLPAEAFGNNSVMDAGWGGRDGVIVTAPVADWLNLTATWARAFSDGNNVDESNNADVFALAAALKFNGFAVTPYVAYASIDDGAFDGRGVDTVGDSSQYLTMTEAGKGKLATIAADSNAYWFGATATLSAFDPFTLKISAAYGKQEYEGEGFDMYGTRAEERDGWNVQAKASYKLGFGTPVLGAWYGSGDDSDAKFLREGWMPSVNGRFLATQDFHDGAWGLGGGAATNNICGTWGVQAGIEDMSFLSDLSHSFKITWIQGTNDDALFKGMKATHSIKEVSGYDGPHTYMTTEDSVIEFALSNTYKIYKNFAANLELAYIINDFDEDLYSVDGKKMYDEDDWRISLGFKYTF